MVHLASIFGILHIKDVFLIYMRLVSPLNLIKRINSLSDKLTWLEHPVSLKCTGLLHIQMC